MQKFKPHYMDKCIDTTNVDHTCNDTMDSYFSRKCRMFQPIVAEITMDQSLARLQRRLPDARKQQTHMAFRVFDDKLINEVAKIPIIYNNRLKEFRNSTAGC